MRTTLDIDSPILEEIKSLQAHDKQSLGRLVSDLLASALAARNSTPQRETPPPIWISRSMRALVDLSDKDALYAAMDSKESER